MKTNERRNRELLGQLMAAIRKASGSAGIERGYGDSLYVNVGLDDWEGILRVSDHDQPAGGGWSESRGERHGEADISVRIFNAIGENLILEDNGIRRLHLAIASFDSEVPEPIRHAIAKEVERYATILTIRRQASARAAATRQANRARAHSQRLAVWHQAVAEEIARIPDVSLCNAGEEGPDDPGFPRPSVPAGTPFRRQRIEAAQKAIEEACNRARVKRAR